MQSLPESARRFLRESQADYIADLKTLAQIPAPSGQEGERARWCLSWLESHGLKGGYMDKAGNVLYPFCVEEGGLLTVVNAHLDVVFPDLTPLPVRQEGDILYGPGVGDDTANVVALLYMAKLAAEQGWAPKEGFLFAFNTGEEGLGNLKGARQIAGDFSGRIRRWIAVDGGIHGYVNKAVGSKRYRITIRTEGGHSYAAFGNQNAIAAMAQVISALYNIKVPALGRTTYNVGRIEGGTSVNTIAENCSILYEYRSDDRRGLARMELAFRAVMETYRHMGFSLEAEQVGDRPCMAETDLSELDALMAEAGGLFGLHMEAGPGSTDCNIPLSLGIPAVCFGVYEGEGAHTRGEWVDLSTTSLGRELLAQVLWGIVNS